MSFKAGDRVVVIEGKLKKYSAVYPVLRLDNSGSHLAIRLFGEFLVPCFVFATPHVKKSAQATALMQTPTM